MTSKPHKKHAKLAVPEGGRFHRSEFAILGAPCDIIQNFSQQLATSLSPDHHIGYVDAAHNSEARKDVFTTVYSDNIDHHALTFQDEAIDYRFRSLFNTSDAVLINGNHFKAAKQIVLINEKKRASLERKLDRLTNVTLFVLDDGQQEVFSFLEEHVDDYASIPVFSIKDVEGITGVLKHEISSKTPGIKGLVLAGGKSTRMGQDKGNIDYHGKPQREYLADLMSGFCEETFISVRNEASVFDTQYPLIADSFHDLGPYGGILSAFRKDPNSAWLTIATDIPLLDKKTLDYLIRHRNPSKLATCFHNPETGFPEPLITLWEPRAYPVLLQFLANGYSCPRKVLINSDIEELKIDRTEVLSNVNTQDELASILPKVNA
ncbi:NTP transferase domain-containing protein [Fulvivirga sp. M361]|uniref:NTP transferase domain-containing protein n=1 Tax=Fulvivirga sp. M361 TaxID=2594266 RepID=UPI001C88AD84|nr:NTP transferase domain-containing protein [Fulvivirga sp. M361]